MIYYDLGMFNIPPYYFIIDTDSYAGNFERELCAYCTGHWDYETHGEEQALLFKKEVGDPEVLFESIAYVGVGDGYQSCQTLEVEPTVDQYNSVAISFSEKPTIEQIKIMRHRAEKFTRVGQIFNQPVKFKILGYRLIQKTIHTKNIII
jgi:hypothetical protein